MKKIILVVCLLFITGCIKQKTQLELFNEMPKPAIVVSNNTPETSYICTIKVRDAKGKYHNFFGQSVCGFKKGEIVK